MPTLPTTFTQVGDLLAFSETHPSAPYSVYWNARRDAPEALMSMLFYTDDGFVILGLVVEAASEAAQMARLRAFADATYVAAWDEQAPPSSASEFRARCEQLNSDPKPAATPS